MVNYYKDMWRHQSHLLAATDQPNIKQGQNNGQEKRSYQMGEGSSRSLFDKIKQVVTNDVMLTFPDLNKPFEIHTNASDFQLGAPRSSWSKKA
jgi:hypothetical protein